MSGATTKSVTKHFYNDAGHEIRKEAMHDDGSKQITTYIRDAAGTLVRLESSEDGDEPIVTTYEYDSDGRRIGAKRGYATWTYQYDADGNVIHYKYSPYLGSTVEKTYTYTNGRLESILSSEKNPVETTTYLTTYNYGNFYIYTPAA